MIQSIQRAYSILQLFEKYKSLRITDISNMLDLHKSTAFGIANTLEQLGLLTQDQQTGLYSLGLELYRLGTHVDMCLNKICSPYLQQLSEDTEETVNLVAQLGSDIIFLDKFESLHSMRIFTYIGQRLPMYCTATGKVFLAFMPLEKACKILDSIDMAKNTDNTITTPEQIISTLPQLRKQGYAIDHEELEVGLVSIAVPILDEQNKPVAAISVSGPTSRMSERCCNDIKNKLFVCQAKIQNNLGYM